MLLSLLLQTALASPDAVQVRAFEGAVAFAESIAESVDPSWSYADLFATDVGCYDQVGVRDFNLSVPIDTVDLQLDNDTLWITVDFGTIEGTSMTLYGEDYDWLDACPEFETPLYYARILNGQVTAALELDGGFGGFFGSPTLGMDWAEAPLVTGDIETDIAWVPDSIVMFFLEDALKQAAADAMSEAVPPMIEEFLGETSYAGDYGGLATALELSDATLTPDALSMYVDLDLTASALTPCEIGNPGSGPKPTGRSTARLPLDQANGADLGVGLTEQLIADGLHAAWEAGWFCFESDSIDGLVGALGLWIDPEVASLEAWAALDSPPTIEATAAGVDLTIPDVRMEITGLVNGSRVPIVVVSLDVMGTAIPGFDADLSSMTLSLVDPRFDFTKVQLEHIPAPRIAQPLIEREIEAWASDWARDALQNVVLFDALYYAWDIVLLLDHTETRDGGLEMYFELYDIDDPAVDTVSPEATIASFDQSKRGADLVASATDDRPEPLAYAWQVNGGGWSAWTTDPELRLSNLPDGDYTVELTARDRWLNADETPDSVQFTVKGPSTATGDTGCGCNTPSSGGPGLALLTVGLLGRRRR